MLNADGSENNILACEETKIVPLIAVARQDHHPHWSKRFTEPEPLKADATPLRDAELARIN